MAPNFSYNEQRDVAVAGQVVNTLAARLVSRNVETAAGVAFGVPVKRGATDKSCAVMAAGATEVIGITVIDRTVAPSDTSPDTYAQYDSANLMTFGDVWVTVTDAGGVSDGDDVWVLLADGTFSNADAGGGASLKLPGCKWETTAANGAVAQIHVNLDVPAVAGAA